MRYKVAMYDWNGSVANDPRVCHECVLAIFREFGPELPLPSFEAWRSGHGNTNFLEFYYERGIPRSVTIHMMRGVWAPHYETRMSTKTSIIRGGVRDLLILCRGHEMSNVIVSSSIDNVERHLRDAKVRRLFDDVMVGVPSKPAAFAEVMQIHGVSPKECFYVDDTYDGIRQAKEAGITTFGLTTGCNDEARIRAALPDYPVASFHEIIAIVR